MKDREEYISILEQDNAELKKQLEECKIQNINLREDIMIKKIAFPNNKIKDKTFYNLYDMPSYEDLLNQQQEFIKYLKSYIELLNDNPDLIEESQIDLLKEIKITLYEMSELDFNNVYIDKDGNAYKYKNYADILREFCIKHNVIEIEDLVNSNYIFRLGGNKDEY